MLNLLGLILLFSCSAFAVPCDCEVRVHSPLTGSNRMSPVVIKNYELEDYDRIYVKSIEICRQSCLQEFQKDMPAIRLKALLETYAMQLIEEKVLGFNCSGFTTLKFPIRVKAKLGKKSLGNVSDFIQVIEHEEVCF